jgi:hypothetical protein
MEHRTDPGGPPTREARALLARVYRDLIVPHRTLDAVPRKQRDEAVGKFLNISYGPINEVLSVRAAPRRAVEALLADDGATVTQESAWCEAVGPVAAWVIELMQHDGWEWHADAGAFFKAGEPETFLDDAIVYLTEGE